MTTQTLATARYTLNTAMAVGTKQEFHTARKAYKEAKKAHELRNLDKTTGKLVTFQCIDDDACDDVLASLRGRGVITDTTAASISGSGVNGEFVKYLSGEDKVDFIKAIALDFEVTLESTGKYGLQTFLVS